jgi:hypothetical protein
MQEWLFSDCEPGAQCKDAPKFFLNPQLTRDASFIRHKFQRDPQHQQKKTYELTQNSHEVLEARDIEFLCEREGNGRI